MFLKSFFLISRRTTISVVKQLSSGKTRFFAGHYRMFGANIQACIYSLCYLHECTLKSSTTLEEYQFQKKTEKPPINDCLRV